MIISASRSRGSVCHRLAPYPPMNVEASGSRLDAEYVVIRNGDSPHIIETDARK